MTQKAEITISTESQELLKEVIRLFETIGFEIKSTGNSCNRFLVTMAPQDQANAEIRQEIIGLDGNPRFTDIHFPVLEVSALLSKALGKAMMFTNPKNASLLENAIFQN